MINHGRKWKLPLTMNLKDAFLSSFGHELLISLISILCITVYSYKVALKNVHVQNYLWQVFRCSIKNGYFIFKTRIYGQWYTSYPTQALYMFPTMHCGCFRKGCPEEVTNSNHKTSLKVKRPVAIIYIKWSRLSTCLQVPVMVAKMLQGKAKKVKDFLNKKKFRSLDSVFWCSQLALQS